MADVDYLSIYNDEQGVAGANLNASQGVPQGAALTAIQHGPSVGVDPELAMQDPEQVYAAAQSQQHTQALQHPSVKSWAATSSANVAATKDDWSKMADLADRLGHVVGSKDFLNPGDFFAPGVQAVKDLGDFKAHTQQSLQFGKDHPLLSMIPFANPEERRLAGDLFNTAMAVPLGGMNVASQNYARILSAFGPAPGKTADETYAENVQAMNLALMAVGSGKVRAGSLTEGAPVPMKATVVGDADSPQPQRLLPGPRSAPEAYAAQAEADAGAAAQLQGQVAQLSFHGQAPELTEDFIENHTDAQGQNVWVDPRAIVEQYGQGHEPFQDYGPEIAEALATGRHLQLPLSTYLAESAGQPWADAVNQATRFREDGLSQTEAKDASDLAPLRDEIEGQPGVNVRRMANMLGPQLYGDPSVTAEVTAKEVLQNSFDAIKSAMQQHGLENGRIDVELDRPGRTITFTDNGLGMDPELLGGKFLQIAGSEKGENASGGFGIAKMLFLYGNNDLKVETLKNGRYSVMHTSGPELMDALEDGAKPKIQVLAEKDHPSHVKELFPEGHGTRISLQIPETYNDPKTGEAKDIPFPYDHNDIPALKHSPLFAPVDVRWKREYDRDFKPVEGAGIHFDHSSHTTFANVKFPWGNARVYISKKHEKKQYDDNVHILSNGLWQFSYAMSKDPMNAWADKLPYTIYADIKPNVKPEQAGYPFGFNRQAFTDIAKKDWAKIASYIQASYGQKALAAQAEEFHKVRYMNGDGTFSEPVELKPELPPGQTGFDKFNEGDKVEIKDGILYVNGEEMPELNPEDLKAAVPKSDELKVPQDLVDPNRVMFHDNAVLTLKDDAGLPFEVPLGDEMEIRFGERWGQFVQFIGDSMIKLRNETARVMGYDELAKEATGISLDKSYRGVSVKLPFSGMFLNPLAPEYADPFEAGYGLIGTMIHEFAHHQVRSHNAKFPAEMQRIMLKLEAETRKGGSFNFPGFKDAFVGTLAKQYSDIIAYGKEQFDAGRVENAGKSFEDAGFESNEGAEGDGEGLGGNARALQGMGQGDGEGRGTGGSEPGPDGVSGQGTADPHAGATRLSGLAQDIAEATATTRAALDEAERELGLKDLFYAPKDVGLNKRQFELYAAKLAEWRQGVENKVIGKLVKEFYKERTPEWKAEIAQQRDAAEKELADVPLLQAYSALTRQKGVLGEPLVATKLDPNDDIAKFGKDLGLPDKMFKKGGLTADQVAAVYGFQSGAQIIRELGQLRDAIGTRTFDKYVKDSAQQIAENRARQKLGYDTSKEAMVQEAYESVAVPAIEDLLARSLVDLAKQVGRKISKEDIKALAKEQFETLSVNEGKNPRVFERAVKSTGEKALRHLEKGEFGEAFNARWQQLLNFNQLYEAWAFSKNFAKHEKLLRKWGKNEAVRGTDPVIGAILQKAAKDLGYASARDTEELDRFLAQAQAKGLAVTPEDAVDVANGYGFELEAAPIVGHNAATVAEWRAMIDMLKGLQKFGKELHEVKVGADTWEFTALTNAVQAEADRIGRRYTPQELLDSQDTMFKRLGLKVKSLYVNNIRPEVPLYWLDGEKQGPLMKSVVNPLMGGKHQETDLINDWIKSMRKSVSDEYLASTDKGIDVPDIMLVQTAKGPLHVIKTRGNLRVALLHLGSESARRKLIEGFGWGEEQENWLLEQATPEDWKFARAFWDENEKLFKLADEMYMRVRGYGLVKDPQRDVTLPDGTTMAGGHIHIQYNSTIQMLTRLVEGAEDTLMAMPQGREENPLDEKQPIRAMPSAFYGIKRTGFVGPVDLNPRLLSRGVSEVIHDISFREPLMQAQKVLLDPRVREAIATVLGPEYESQFIPWLHYIAKDRLYLDGATKASGELIRDLSSNFVFAKVGFNLSSMIKHSGIGLAHMVREVGDPAIFAQAASDLLTDGKYWREFIANRSGEVRGLQWNIDTNLQEALARDALTGGKLHDARQAAFFLFAWSKRMEAEATWLSVYRREMAAHGVNGTAIAAADKSVRDTQGAGASVDLPAFFRKGDDWSTAITRNVLGLLMGFHNTTANRLWTARRSLNPGGNQNFGKAGGIGLTYILGAALVLALYEVYVRGGGNARKSKDENFLEELGWSTAEQTLGSFIGMNKLMELAHYGSEGEFSRLVESGKKVAEGKGFDERAVLEAVKFAGSVTGFIPDVAVNLAAAGYDAATGQIGSASSFLQRGVLGRQGMEGGSGSPSRRRVSRTRRQARGSGTK